jgi:hypothetical protein
MPRYEYNGEDERVFPTLGLTVNKGDSFDGPEGLTAAGLSIVSSAKTAPAVSTAVKEQVKETTTPPASSGITAGA